MIEYKTRNGLTMVESEPFNWQKEISGDNKIIYSIYVGSFSDGHMCSYFPDDNNGLLVISNISLDSGDPSLRFRVDTIEEAGNIVYMFSKGMNVDMLDTIYLPKKTLKYFTEDDM